jgi:hypothetical protein
MLETQYYNRLHVSEIWGSRSSEDVDHGLLDCDTVVL